MTQTPNRFPGISDEEGTIYEIAPVPPISEGEVRYVTGVGFQMQDLLGVFNPRNGSSVFGEYYTYAASEAQSDTTNTAFQTKSVLITPAVAAGTYIVFWSAEVRSSLPLSVEELRLLLDGATVLAVPAQTHVYANVWAPASGIMSLPLAAGVHTLTLQWRRVGILSTVSIRRARVAVWRAS